MPSQAQWIGFTWQEPPAILPRLLTAMHYSKTDEHRSGRISHPFWVLDYSRGHCGRVRVGSDESPWIERPPAIAHLYPPGTAYWEDQQTPSGMMEGAYVVFAGGDEAGLRVCIPKGQPYARISDPDGALLESLRAAATAGGEKGEAGFWEAQAALCALIQTLHGVVPGEDGGLVIRPAAAKAPSEFVKAVDSFLGARLGGRVSLAEIAKAMRVSSSALSHKYAAETGSSPLGAFNSMRLEAARSLILRGLKLDAVAAQTGFCDAYHLSKAFTRHFSVSPVAYRRLLSGTQFIQQR